MSKSPSSVAQAGLAIDGQSPVRTAPLPPWPYFEDEEIQAANAVLKSGKVNYWTGTEGREFEKEYAAYVGTKHAIALANGTNALELALWALGIGPGDEVITTSRTFIASASCIVMRGATPVIADVDLDSQSITAETIERAITPRTKAIIPVHLAGWPCDMDPILELAKKHNLKVIEDCAQAHGATYKGRPVGSMGHINAFSFCQDKIMTTGGEGGMVTTNDKALWEKAWSAKDHGKSYDAVYNRKHPVGIPLAARIVRHELAADGDAVRDGAGAAAQIEWSGGRAALIRPDDERSVPECSRPEDDAAGQRHFSFVLQVLRFREA